MAKRFGIATVFMAALTVLMLTGCPQAADDPWVGNLKPGAVERPVVSDPTEPSADAFAYNVKLNGIAAEGGQPTITFLQAVPGAVFLGEGSVQSDVTDMKLTLTLVYEDETASLSWGVTANPRQIPGTWTPYTSTNNVITGVIPSGQYLVLKYTADVMGTTVDTFQMYQVLWGNDGTGIDYISIGGRVFPVTGFPSTDGTETGTTGIVSTDLFLTMAQSAANRPVEVVMRSDSQLAHVFWGLVTGASGAPSGIGYTATPPAASAFTVNPPTGTFQTGKNNYGQYSPSVLWARVRSANGTWANYRFPLFYEDYAIMGLLELTPGKATIGATGNITTDSYNAARGRSAGTWNHWYLQNGQPLKIKANRLQNNVAKETAASIPTAKTYTWAYVPDLTTEPAFASLDTPINIPSDFSGYIYVKVERSFEDGSTFLQIYRFPIEQEPLSAVSALTDIKIDGTSLLVAGSLPGTAGTTWQTAQEVSSTSIGLLTSQLKNLPIAVSWADANADMKVEYARQPSGSSAEPVGLGLALPVLSDGDTLFIKATSENGNNSNWYKVSFTASASNDARVRSVLFGESVATIRLGRAALADITSDRIGQVDLYTDWTASTAITVEREASSTVQFAVTSSESVPVDSAFSATVPHPSVGQYVWVKNTAEDNSTSLYYAIKVRSTRQGRYGRGIPDPEYAAKYPYLIYPNLAQGELLLDNIGPDGIPTKMPPPNYWNTLNVPGASGHIHTYPSPFHFANGNRVATLADWDNRRREMLLINGYYHKGDSPQLDKRIVKMTLSGANNGTINLTHIPSGRTLPVTVGGLTTGTPAVGKEGYYGFANSVTTANSLGSLGGSITAPSAANIHTFFGYPAGTGSSSRTSRDSRGGFAYSLVISAIEGVDDSGAMQYLRPVPSGTHKFNESGEGSWYTFYGPAYATGVSTGGKQAQAYSSMSMPRGKGRMGWVLVGDAGSMGPALERFINVAGLRLDVSLQEALKISNFSATEIATITQGLPDNSAGLGPRQGHAATLYGRTRTPGFYNTNPDGTLKMGEYRTNHWAGPGDVVGSGPVVYGWQVDILPVGHVGPSSRQNIGSLGGFQDLWGIPRYLSGVKTDDPMNGTDLKYGTPAASLQTNARHKNARGWAPYFEPFGGAIAVAATNTFGVTARNTAIEFPVSSYQSIVSGSNGIQNFMQGRNENTGNDWNGSTFRQFNDLHYGLNIDHAFNDPWPARGIEGMACVVPTDMYFATVTMAPYGGILIQSPDVQTRTNTPSQWAHWLIMDEAYKMYGELEYYEETGNMLEDPKYPGSGLYMGWDKYIWNNVMDNHSWHGHAGQQSPATNVTTAYRARHLESGVGRGTTTEDALTDISKAWVRDPVYNIDDPGYYFEYRKMDWGRPKPDGSKGVNISERIRRRVEPILQDYYKAEIYRQPSAVSTDGVYADGDAYWQAAKDAISSSRLTFSGTKYKPWDWRGLIDNPEPMVQP